MNQDKPIQVLDLGISNLGSVLNMIRKCEGKAVSIDQPTQIIEGSKLVIAGVGKWDTGVEALKARNWHTALNKAVLQGRNLILGICLGMQLMCKDSEEGTLPGLGWFDATVKRIPQTTDQSIKIPHMGWNQTNTTRSSKILSPSSSEQRFYYVHSYYAKCNNNSDILATTVHGSTLTAAIHKNNIYGVQFHPEKSHRFGMELISNFVSI